MKQGLFVIPKAKIRDFAKFLAENGIFTNLSWMEGDGLFADKMHAVISFPEDKEDKVKANWGTYHKEK